MNSQLEDRLDSLQDLLNGEVEMSQAWQCFDRDLLIHAGGMNGRGIQHWFTWFRLIKRFGRVDDLQVDFEELTVQGDQVEVAMRWRGTRAERPVVSNVASAKYRISEGKIVEIWTQPANYVFVFGTAIRYRPVAVCLWLLGWSYLRLADWLRPEPNPPWKPPPEYR